MFDSLVDFLKTNIDELNGYEVQISSEFKEHHNEDSKYIIKNWLFSSPEYRKWRITRLDGGKKLQVFNTVAYPTFDIEMPILGADILWFGTSQKLLAILDYQPLIQTSRFCPYTCAFCVSGKNRGKLRGYPIEQVEEELRFVSKKYSDRPHHVMMLVDENFGILKRDVEIAHIIKKCTEDFGFPQSVFFYNDKRFTETSRSVIEILGWLNQYGMCLSLQTENPNTLKAISRVNVTAEQIDDAIKWASERNIPASTELIFGLPHETRDGFINLMNRSIDRGFDTVKVHNLFVMDGIELNRPAIRKKYGIKTKFRLLGTNYGAHNGNFLAEHEEVVVSSNSFTYENFLEARGLKIRSGKCSILHHFELARLVKKNVVFGKRGQNVDATL